MRSWIAPALLASLASAGPDGGSSAEEAHGDRPAQPSAVDPGVVIERKAPTAAERLQKRLEQDAEEARVRTGKVHPRLMDIRRTAQETFDPSWDLVEDHPREIGSMTSTVKEAGKSVLQSWMRQAPRYAANEPMPQPPRHPGKVLPGEEDDPTLLEQYDTQVRSAVDDANTLTAVACVRLASGKEPVAEITRTSGSGRFDRLARANLLAAARARPVPTDLEPARVCYRFAAHFATVPPVPYVSCSLEKSDRSKNRCIWPLRRLVARDVDLVSVE